MGRSGRSFADLSYLRGLGGVSSGMLRNRSPDAYGLAERTASLAFRGYAVPPSDSRPYTSIGCRIGVSVDRRYGFERFNLQIIRVSASGACRGSNLPATPSGFCLLMSPLP